VSTAAGERAMTSPETRFTWRGRQIALGTFGPEDHISRIIESTKGFYEPDVLERAAERHVPGTTILDVGANLGNHTVFFAKVIGAKVHAFEPHRKAFELLQSNIARNGIVGLVRAADFAIGRAAGRGALEIVAAGNLGQTRVRRADSGEVEIRSIDDLRFDAPIGLIKIDVEGGECDVLDGAEATIRRERPDLFIEAEDDAAFRRVLARVLPLGYVLGGRYAWTPTYLFTHGDQSARLRDILERLDRVPPG
jgi:FkbM family methyltransferase